VTEHIIKEIDFAATQNNIPFVSVKITGIASHKLLENLNEAPRLRSGIHDSESEDAAWQRVRERMAVICDVAQEKGVGILIDAEESWIQDPIDRLAIELMSIYNKEKAIVYNTYQLYRNDRLHFLQLSHRIAKDKNFLLGAKLVRGAYMEKERARAQKNGYPSPIQIDKESTDKDFDAAALYCIENKETISLLLATHNENSNIKITSEMERLGVANNNTQIHFSQLYGMGDHITFNMAKLGYNVSKYLPYGPINEVIPYLMRRAEENSSVNGQTNNELILLKTELKRRRVN
jgi:proline dehydrogenase